MSTIKTTTPSNHHTTTISSSAVASWSSSLTERQDDLLAHLKESRARDAKKKAQLAEMIRSSLEECIAENKFLTDAITQLVDEAKFMEHQYKKMEIEVTHLRLLVGNNNNTSSKQPAKANELIEFAEVRNEKSHNSGTSRSNHVEWKQEREDLKAQIELQRQEIKFLKSRLKRMKKSPNNSINLSMPHCSTSQDDFPPVDPDEYMKRFTEKCRGRTQSTESADKIEKSAMPNNANDVSVNASKKRRNIVASREESKLEKDQQRMMQKTWHGGSGGPSQRKHMNNILKKHADSPKASPVMKQNEGDIPGANKSDLELFLEGCSTAVNLDSSQNVIVPQKVSINQMSRGNGQNLKNTWHGGSLADRGTIHSMLVGNPQSDERRRYREGSTSRQGIRRGSANDIEFDVKQFLDEKDSIPVEKVFNPIRTQNIKRRSSASAVEFEKFCEKSDNLQGSSWHGGANERKRMQMLLLGGRKASQEFDDKSFNLGESVEDTKLNTLVESAKELGQSFTDPDEPGGIISDFEWMDGTNMSMLGKSSSSPPGSNGAVGRCDLLSRKISHSSMMLENQDVLFYESPSVRKDNEEEEEDRADLSVRKDSRTDSSCADGNNINTRNGILKKYRLLPKLGRQKKMAAELA